MLYGLSLGRAYPIFIFIGFCTSNEGPYKMGTIIYRLFSQFFVPGSLSKNTSRFGGKHINHTKFIVFKSPKEHLIPVFQTLCI